MLLHAVSHLFRFSVAVGKGVVVVPTALAVGDCYCNCFGAYWHCACFYVSLLSLLEVKLVVVSPLLFLAYCCFGTIFVVFVVVVVVGVGVVVVLVVLFLLALFLFLFALLLLFALLVVAVALLVVAVVVVAV